MRTENTGKGVCPDGEEIPTDPDGLSPSSDNSRNRSVGPDGVDVGDGISWGNSSSQGNSWGSWDVPDRGSWP